MTWCKRDLIVCKDSVVRHFLMNLSVFIILHATRRVSRLNQPYSTCCRRLYTTRKVLLARVAGADPRGPGGQVPPLLEVFLAFGFV